MKASELAADYSTPPTESVKESDSDFARDALIGGGVWDDIVSYADRISAETVTGYLKRNREKRAAAVILWSPDNDDSVKGIRVSHLQHLQYIEYTGYKYLDGQVFWLDLELKRGEGKFPCLTEQLSMARGNANGRIPREKIFGDW